MTVAGAVFCFSAPAQDLNWSGASGITGDANLSANGNYFDALVPNTAAVSATVDGVVFHAPASQNGGIYGDGLVSFSGASLNNYSWPGSFPVSAAASSAFANLMDAGGIFQNGGAGTGVITLSGLTVGHTYLAQIFNYALDGDAGLTTFSGATPVTLSNLPGAAGANTYGEYATGTFTATASTETFNWSGAGSQYTVVGAISVRDITAQTSILPSNFVNQGDPVTLAVSGQPALASIQWQTDNGSSGANWSNLPEATGTNYLVNTGSLPIGKYEYRVIITNSSLDFTSAPLLLTVIAPSAPEILQDTTPMSSDRYVGQSAEFAAAFTGNHPITNQWQVSLDGGKTYSDLSGATNTSVIVSNLQTSDSGLYRMAASNQLGFAYSAPATLTVQPWAVAHIQWSQPMPLTGLTAGQILTNLPGDYLGAAIFFCDSYLTVTLGAQQFAFRSDGAFASISSADYYSGQFVTNATYGSGAWTPNTTGDSNLDAVLNQYYDGGYSNRITLHRLTPGQQYSVQLFGLDNRGGDTNQCADYADGTDTNDTSTLFAMGGNACLVGTFVASNSDQTIQENLFSGGFGNINALVVRALSYTPAVPPSIVVQPKQRVLLASHSVAFTVMADGAPSPAYQWRAGPGGGPYTNLADGGRYSGTAAATLSLFDVTTNDNGAEYVVAVSNSAGSVVSAPVDLAAPILARPLAGARPIRITCVGASDVSSPTPYGTPNWPDYIAPLLGYEYSIFNAGASGTTMIQQGNAPYWNTPQYTNGINSAPDIVIIMLGSNDSKPYNWIYQTNYTPDYEELISQYRSLPSHPRIYLATLLTVYGVGNYDITDPIVTGQLCPIIRQIAFDEGFPLVDINTATENMPQNFPDNVHPDIAGAKFIAQTYFNALMSAGETPPMIDQALNKPVVASSVASGSAAANAVDGDYTTMWTSAASDSQWIYVDLGAVTNINGVYLNWGANYGKSYKIQISPDAAAWTDVFSTNTAQGGIDRIGVSASGRYVRMLGLASGGGAGYSLLDFTVTVPPPPPRLGGSRNANGSLNLSWPTSPASYEIESTASLAAPDWTPFTPLIVLANGTNSTTITPLAGNLFFRLRQE